MHYSLLSLLLTHLAISQLSQAALQPHLLENRAACNADNCLRALDNHASSANPFCSAYTTTTNTATTGLPTYIPAECSPSRVSSACSCFITPPAPSPCPTGQVLTDPDFYGCTDDYGYCGPMLAPWTIQHIAGAQGCILGNGYTYSYDGDPSAITCQFNTTGGTDRIIHPLDLCPGHNYTLTAHLGYTSDDAPSGSPTFKVLVGTQTLVPAQHPCGSASVPCEENVSGSYFRAVTAQVTGPTDGPSMQLIFEVSAPPTPTQLYGFLLLDTITLYAN